MAARMPATPATASPATRNMVSIQMPGPGGRRQLGARGLVTRAFPRVASAVYPLDHRLLPTGGWPVTGLEKLRECRLREVSGRSLASKDDYSAAPDCGRGDGAPCRLERCPVGQGEGLAQRINGKPVRVSARPGTRGVVRRGIGAVHRLARARGPGAFLYVGGTGIDIKNKPVNERRDRRRGVVDNKREALGPGRRARPV